MSVLGQFEEKMKGAITHLIEELKAVRTGHANAAMLEGVMVEVYGTHMRLRDIASVNVPELRQLLVTPYDPHNVDPIRKGLEKANLGFNPIVDGHAIRINIPSMDESMRKEMVKICHKKAEDAKVNIRKIRQNANETIRKQKADGEMGEDEMKKVEKKIQELTDKYCKEADETSAKKEKEVSTI